MSAAPVSDEFPVGTRECPQFTIGRQIRRRLGPGLGQGGALGPRMADARAQRQGRRHCARNRPRLPADRPHEVVIRPVRGETPQIRGFHSVGRGEAAGGPLPGLGLAKPWPPHGRLLAARRPPIGRLLAARWPLFGRAIFVVRRKVHRKSLITKGLSGNGGLCARRGAQTARVHDRPRDVTSRAATAARWGLCEIGIEMFHR